MSPWEKLLERPHSRGHFVQLYEADEVALTKNVGLYLWEGLRRGEGVLVIVTPEHRELFCGHLDHLGADLPELLGSRQLVFWDAQQTLAQFMDSGEPDWQRFESIIRAAMRQVRPNAGAEGLRAYGEMVGLLWKARQFAAAIRLEQLCTHTHLVPAQPNGTLETALNRSMDEILGPKADALRVLIKANYRPAWAVMPAAEAIVLWLRKNLPGQADHIIERSRHHYQLLLDPAGSSLFGER
jgi:MEDS: MEthanogen/methylotroph, DcmR Sensory domain